MKQITIELARKVATQGVVLASLEMPANITIKSSGKQFDSIVNHLIMFEGDYYGIYTLPEDKQGRMNLIKTNHFLLDEESMTEILGQNDLQVCEEMIKSVLN